MDGAGRKQARSKSFLTRKASKKQQEDPHAQQKGAYGARSASLDMQEKEDAARPLFNPYAISIIPDPLNELPSWYHREVETAAASAAQFRVKYPLHNPAGPRWYRNHHLLPPSSDGRPPSVFSPSFPPMSSAPERGHDPSRMAGPSRTPSGSPLPTPSSSQIRIQEPLKPRTRKISTNTQDIVEIPDGTDAWNPYDQKVDPDSPISPTSPSPTSPNQYGNRPRRASMNHGTRHRTLAPSPLSQSTSAVHLPAIDPAQIQLPRKLNATADESMQAKALRRQSTLGPSMASLPSLQPSVQKPKRGSVLGRLVKRFSVMRKTDKHASQNGYGTNWNHVGSLEPSPLPTTPASPHPPEPRQRTSSRASKSPEPVKRVPPPSIEAVQRDSAHVENRRSTDSLSVHEMPPSGRLMVANPDYPSSGDNTPTGTPTPLPHPTENEASPLSPPSKEFLPEIPRTDSPMQVESVTSPRPHSMRLAASFEQAPPPPSSPPLPDLPPPTPGPVHSTLSSPSESERYSVASTVRALASPESPHLRRQTIIGTASPASTVTPLSAPEDIALARASMYVNPPTPYNAPTSLVIPSSADMPQSSSRRVERSPTKSKDGATRSKSTRQTETFKLVRSPSGTIKQATEVIMGMGEQWEIVETPADAPKKVKSKEKEKEKSKPSDRDQAVHREESRRRRDHSSSAEEGESRHRRHPSTSGREKSPSINSVRSTQTPIVPRRSVKKSSDGEDHRASKTTSASLSPTTPPAQQTRERHLSATGTTRPNSELHSAADFSSVRAKDAWEMERLWKARSMAYGPDGMPIVSTPATIGSESRPSTFISTELQRVSSIPSVAAVAEMQMASSMPPANQVHGSSHTYVVVQTPYQGAQGHAAYAQFPSPPSHNPMMSPAQQFYRHSGYVSPDPLAHNPLPSPPRLSAYQQSPLPMSLTNPLPEPPRLSTYQPAPLPATFSSTGDSSPTGRSQYAGMTNSNTH
ncbi:hypothetical protein C8Q76DRAFT_693153 [Earliella scabrosa]|nr:hypothetical protein C8Q76DRAFT_693153 [Earliella scabrosa]